MKKNILYITLFLVLASCVSRVEKVGYVFETSDYQNLQEGLTSKDQALQFMGLPTFVDQNNEDENWFYLSEKVEKFLFFKPKIIERKILVLEFDAKEQLKKLKYLDQLSENKDLEFSTKYTEVKSQKVGFFKSLFSNVGKITPR